MKTALKLVLAVAVGLMLPFATGHATEKITYSGFLREYPEFKPGPEGGANLIYRKEDIDFTRYTKIMLDHVLFWFHKDADYKGINARELEELADAFHMAIVEALGNTYPLVAKPGPDVLRIRTAITDVVPSKPASATVTAVLPTGPAVSTVEKGAARINAYIGSATLEAELLDSMTGERLGAVIDRRASAKSEPAEAVDKWADAEGAFKFWAGRLCKWLDEVHGRESGND
jgi:hypothetical protein